MTITTLSSRQFNKNVGKAKEAAKSGPVIITDRGKLAHVLLTFEAYQKITGQRTRIADMLAMPGNADVELETPDTRDRAKPASLN